MANETLTLSQALREHIDAVKKSWVDAGRVAGTADVSREILSDIEHALFIAPYPSSPMQGGSDFLKNVLSGFMGIGRDALRGPHYEDGTKALAAYLLEQRAILGLPIPPVTTVKPEPLRSITPIIKRVRRKTRPKPSNE